MGPFYGIVIALLLLLPWLLVGLELVGYFASHWWRRGRSTWPRRTKVAIGPRL